MDWNKEYKVSQPSTWIRKGIHALIPIETFDRIELPNHSFYVQRVICEIIYFRGLPVPLGRISKVRFSENIWKNVVYLSSILKMYGYVQGKYLIVWKRNNFSLWVTFLTKQMLDKYFYLFQKSSDILEKGYKKILEQEIYWMTRRNMWDEKKFHAFFGPGVKK